MDNFNVNPKQIPIGGKQKPIVKKQEIQLEKEFGLMAIKLIRSQKRLLNPMEIAVSYGFVSVSHLEASINDNEELDKEWKLYKLNYKSFLFEWAMENRQKDIVVRMAENDANLLSAEGSIPDIKFVINKESFK